MAIVDVKMRIVSRVLLWRYSQSAARWRPLRADAPTVTAVLTSSETEVDRPVQLQIKVTGDANATPPNDIAVDGLDIRYTGQSQLMEGRNFRFTYSFVYNYTILPLKAGTFTIPPQAVRTSGGTLRTPALTLNVAPNDDGTTTLAPRQSRHSRQRDRRKEDRVRRAGHSKDDCLRWRNNSGARSGSGSIRACPIESIERRNTERPGIHRRSGCRTRSRSIESINGRSYEVVTFKTAITPVRSGKLEISAKDCEGDRADSAPRQGAAPRSPFDIFGMDDPFNDPFFNDPFAGMGEQREVKFSSETTTSTSSRCRPTPRPALPARSGIFP